MASSAADNRISDRDVDRLLAAHDGDMALLFLWMRRHGRADPEAAAGDLCRTLAEVEAAFEKLKRSGLVPEAHDRAAAHTLQAERPAPSRVRPPEEPPEYTAAEITTRAEGDAAFTAVISEAQRALGHALSTPDLKKLFGIYDYLALPAEVIMQLLHYCVETAGGRLPSMRYIEKEAYVWADSGILTLEQADAYISEQARRRKESTGIAECLGIRGREPGTTESRYILSWIDEGTPRELIELAYDRTLTNTGSLKWGYMNKILQNWKEKGLKTAAEVREKDLPPHRRGQPARQPQKPRDIDRLLNQMDKI